MPRRQDGSIPMINGVRRGIVVWLSLRDILKPRSNLFHRAENVLRWDKNGYDDMQTRGNKSSKGIVEYKPINTSHDVSRTVWARE
jgi:hypothetical protein